PAVGLHFLEVDSGIDLRQSRGCHAIAVRVVEPASHLRVHEEGRVEFVDLRGDRRGRAAGWEASHLRAAADALSNALPELIELLRGRRDDTYPRDDDSPPIDVAYFAEGHLYGITIGTRRW